MGGRWNRSGEPALYVSRDHATAIAEFHQSLVRPGTLVAYDVASTGIVDLTDPGFFAAYYPMLNAEDILGCEWRKIWRIENREPPTWTLVDMLRTAGAVGALVPSVQQRGGVNLVFWEWSDQPNSGAQVNFVDPEFELTQRG